MRGVLALATIVLLGILVPRLACKPRPVDVETAAVEIGPVETTIVNSEAGSIRTRANAQLSAERAGRVISIVAREGARVARGTTLLRLDATTARTRLDSAERDFGALDAAHEVAHAEASLARQMHERTRELSVRALVSPEQREQAESRLASAEAALRAAESRRAAAEALVRLQRDEIAHLVVRAPFDGVVARRFVEVGESVVPGERVLELVDLDRLYVSAPIDERDVASLATGLPVRVTVDAFSGRSWEGRLSRIAPVVEETEEQNRTIEIEVELEVDRGSAGPALRPGMTADVEIVLRRVDGAARVPSTAVVEGRRVYALSRGRAVERPVTTGARNAQWTEVKSGLREGELVITSLDRGGLKSGALVRPAGTEGARTGADPP
jgi:HlyD family secretion protein